MRTIKFRGRRIDNGEWVYGTYHVCVGRGTMRRTEWEGGNRKFIDEPADFNRHWILTHRTPTDPGWDVRDTFFPYDVIAETVGQFTDLTDKNGNEIYEGDILFHTDELCEVKWMDKKACFSLLGPFHMIDMMCLSELYKNKMEVAGNIYDNPLITQQPMKQK